MLPAFVIGLREGLEAALIVGIVAAFLRQRGRTDLLRWMWAGVALAASICLAVGVGLKLAATSLPHRQQEGLETVVALVAVAMVTYMVVWMRRHARHLRTDLERAAGEAMASGSGWALVTMAFLAVFREGFETAVFLVAAFNESNDPAASGAGALAGVTVACALGAAIYRGGLTLDLRRVFRATAVVLVLVAAGLVVSALHSAHEAGWLNAGQRRVTDLTWLVAPGSVRSSLLTGMLGFQPRPVVIEVVGWALYLVVVMTFALWPVGRTVAPRTVVRFAGAVAVVAAVVATTAAVFGPHSSEAATELSLATDEAPVAVQIVDIDDARATARLDGTEYDLDLVGTADRAGRRAVEYRSVDITVGEDSEVVTAEALAERNGGRLPLGLSPADHPDGFELVERVSSRATIWFDAATGTVLDVVVDSSSTASVTMASGPSPLGSGTESTRATTAEAVAAQTALARDEATASARAHSVRTAAWVSGLVAGAAAAVAAGAWFVGRRTRRGRPHGSSPDGPARAGALEADDSPADPRTAPRPAQLAPRPEGVLSS